MKKYMDKMKKLKNLLPLAGFIPVIVVAILVYVALDGYIPKVYEIAAAQEKETEATDAADKKNKKNRAEKKEETEKEAESAVADTAKIFTQIDENAKYKDGTYFGTGKGFAGNLTVKVVISSGKIESIVITDTSDGSEFIKKASSILSAIVKGQSTNVDTVSGATYSSVGIIEAVRNALKQAVISGTDDAELNMDVTADTTMGSAETKKVPERLSTVKDEEGYKDGIYYGTGTGFAGELKVKVVIKNGKISEIEIVETKDGDEFIKSASRLLNDIVKKQSTNVDTVSGATYSSNGIIEAVRDALKGAVKNPATDTTTTKRQTTTNQTESKTTRQEQTTTRKNGKYKDGIYYGTGEGFRGDITVGVVIENDKIQYIIVTESEDDDAFIGKAKGLIPDIIKKQGTNVDTVSGATFSSNGIIDAVNNALAKAAKEAGNDDTTTPEHTTEKPTTTKQPDTGTEHTGSGSEDTTADTETTVNNKYKSGTYTVTVNCTPDENWDFDEYQMSVTVTINNDLVTDISNIKGIGAAYDNYNDWYINRAVSGTSRYPGVVSQLKGKGSAEADAVSGATCSSHAIIEAVKKAFAEAERLR